MNDFAKLVSIYEGIQVPDTLDVKNSYNASGMYGNKGADNYYNMNLPTNVPVGEQEEEKEKLIALSKCKSILDKAISEASKDGMDYAVLLLSSVKRQLLRI